MQICGASWFHSGRQTKKVKTRQNGDDTQISWPDLRFAIRKDSKTNTEKGPNAHTKNTGCLGHGGRTQRVMKNALRNKLASLRPKKQCEKNWTVKSSNKLAVFNRQAIHCGSHLRVLSDELCPSSRRLVIFGNSCKIKKHGCTFRRRLHKQIHKQNRQQGQAAGTSRVTNRKGRLSKNAIKFCKFRRQKRLCHRTYCSDTC